MLQNKSEEGRQINIINYPLILTILTHSFP